MEVGLRPQVREGKDTQYISQDKLFNCINWESNSEITQIKIGFVYHKQKLV